MIFFNRLKELFSIIQKPKLLYYLTLISLFPLLLLSYFNNPGSDDFEYAFESQTEPFWSLQLRRYNEWSGRYFSNGLLSLDPLYFDDYYGFKILPVILFSLFIVSIYLFLSGLFNWTKRSKMIWSSVLVFLYLFLMPDICEGFYWMPGAITNQLPVSLSLLYFTSVIQYFKTRSIGYIGLAVLLLTMTLGCNEIIVVLMLLITLLTVVVYAVQNKKINRVLLFLFVVTCGLAAIEIFAPGNAVRGSNFKVKNLLLFSLFKSSQLSLSYITLWSPFLLLVCFFLYDEIKEKIAGLDSKYFLNPMLLLGLTFIIVYVGIFPGLWSTSGAPPGRTINTTVFFFIISFLYCFISLVYHYSDKVKVEINTTTKTILGILIIFNFLSHNNITVAYKDLFSGKAYKYDKELKARFSELKTTTNTACIIAPLNNFPTTIYNVVDMGLTNDKNNWKNLEVSEYFRKKSIVVKVNDSTITE